MRVKVRVVGNTLALEEPVKLPPEGMHLVAELTEVTGEASTSKLDDVEEVLAAVQEADADGAI